MNKKYTCIDGITVVSDENENLFQINQTENIEEILEQENVIEELERLIENKNNDLFSCKCTNIVVSFIFILFLVAVVVIGNFEFSLSDLSDVEILVLRINSLGFITIDGLCLFIYRFISKSKKDLNNEIPFLEKSLELEKEKLQKLSLGKQIERKGVGITINEKKKLDLLNRKLQLYLLLKKRLENNPSEFENPSFNHELYTKEEMMEIKEIIESEIERPKVLTK